MDWNNLRQWNGSQNAAFEELCCQLAHAEGAPPGAKFVRKAPPDAGIECFWLLATGDEWGWQAKFFLSAPDDGRWKQIDDSVETALTKHPRLTRYTICLPVDRADPRQADHEFFMDKWNSHVAKWRLWAQNRGMSVEFEYLGHHEIALALSKEEHRGRCYFWFNEEVLSQAWFRRRLEESVAAADARYTAELNVNLPIATAFEGLGRTQRFFDNFTIQRGTVRKKHWYLESRESDSVELKSRLADINQSIAGLLALLEPMKGRPEGPLQLTSISDAADAAIARIRALLKAVRDMRRAPESEDTSQESNTDLPERKRALQEISYYGRDLIRSLEEITAFCASSAAKLANLPALLLVGNAGTGKTHLFCDIAQQRLDKTLPTVVMLGEFFRDDDPWSQLIKKLGLVCSRDEFLGALDAAAEAAGSRALILIDALNEGAGKLLWRKELPALLLVLSRLPRLGLAISVRASYEPIVVPKGLDLNRLVRVVHHGFSGHEYEATRTFFDHYGIQQPTVPLLASEFDNPLFLKLFCKGLKNKGVTSFPKGLRGIKKVFDFFLESVNEKLAHPGELDFDPSDRLVGKAVHRLAELMADSGVIWLERSVAADAVNSFYSHQGNEGSLFQRLNDEGVITREAVSSTEDEWHEVVHFTYERLADHLVAEVLLDRHLNASSPQESFNSHMPLGKMVQDEQACWMNRGLVDAWSVQLPERINEELGNLAPQVAESRPVLEAFVQSIVWRTPESIGSGTLDYINQHVIQYTQINSQFLDALLTVAGDPAHPYNALFLHSYLMGLTLPNRDYTWSIFIHDQYGEHAGVDRLIDWAWSDRPKTHISDDAILLTGVALAWFFTSSNRFLRDRATKALVALLAPRLRVAHKCLKAFKNVNDPYVIERVMAVAYGCAMRSTDMDSLREMAKDIYEYFFSNGTPPPSLLLRDYARGIVECARDRGMLLDINARLITPPYRSEWSNSAPSEEALKEQYKANLDDRTEQERALSSIYWSVIAGDFGRDIIGASSGVFHWSARRLGDKTPRTKREKYEAFVSTLDSHQEEMLKEFRDAMSARQRLTFDKATRKVGIVSSKRGIKKLETVKRQLVDSLGTNRTEIFLRDALPYLEDSRESQDPLAFDLNLVQRWILQKILDLGWTVERFGSFDRWVTLSAGLREKRKTERIGEKYQWIAYNELLARVSDNFEFRKEPWSEHTGKYEGPWQIFRRDIDPSAVLHGQNREGSDNWWLTLSYDQRQSENDDRTWLEKEDDLPDPKKLISLSDPSDGRKWLCLDTSLDWEESAPLDEERFERPRRSLWLFLRCYMVRRQDADDVFAWAAKQDFWGRWMPETSEAHYVFLGEYFWAPSFVSQEGEYFGRPSWTKSARANSRLPYTLLEATDRYSWSASGYDSSIEDSISIALPCEWLAKGMGLSWKGREGYFYDAHGRIVAFDPSVAGSKPSAALVAREELLTFLEREKTDLLWTVIGAKRFIGGSSSPGHWKGELQINGSYRLRGNDVEGSLRTKFRNHSS